MINNEMTKIQNKKDLKFYRFIIAMFIVASIVIAIGVGISTIDSYKAGANATNGFIDMLMPKSIEGTEEGGSAGLIFYREKNEDFDVEKDEPLAAFKYYMLSDDGKKLYLDDGMYYPPEYYMENSKVEPVAVYLGFYFKMYENLQTFNKVLKIVVAIICVALAAGLIYIWYRLWCRREDERKAREEAFNQRFNKKNN